MKNNRGLFADQPDAFAAHRSTTSDDKLKGGFKAGELAVLAALRPMPVSATSLICTDPAINATDQSVVLTIDDPITGHPVSVVEEKKPPKLQNSGLSGAVATPLFNKSLSSSLTEAIRNAHKEISTISPPVHDKGKSLRVDAAISAILSTPRDDVLQSEQLANVLGALRDGGSQLLATDVIERKIMDQKQRRHAANKGLSLRLASVIANLPEFGVKK